MLHYFHAVRHLKPIQIYGYIRNKIVARTFSSDYWTKRARALRLGECTWNPIGEFLPSGPQHNFRDEILDGNLTFLNIEKRLGFPFDWTPAGVPLLWEYNLHYFEYIFALEYDEARHLVTDWIKRYPLRRHRCGWEAYTSSLRIMCWCAYFFHRHRSRIVAGSEFESLLKQGLALHAAWIRYRLEYHLLVNHYFENIAALVVIGSCFDGPDAGQWFDFGMRLLKKELSEQILSDGIHIERSPMYHSRVLYVLRFLLNMGNNEVVKLVQPYCEKAALALMNLCHPDGDIALFNDAAFGIYNAPEQLCETGNNDVTETFSLPDAGYFGAKTSNGHYLLCDAGPIGPDYFPSHAHGDIFSFELSLFGKRMIVDSGVYDYVDSPERRYTRSTAAHNTVEINGTDQCEFFSTFRVGRRGRPHDVKFEETETGFRLSGWHDGYRRLPSRAIHHRSFEWSHCGSLLIVDRVEAIKDVDVVTRFHLHPECRIVRHDERCIVFERETHRCRLEYEGGTLNIASYDYSPEFHQKHPAIVLELSATGMMRSLRTNIAPEEAI